VEAGRPHVVELLPVALGLLLSLAGTVLLPLSGFCGHLSGLLGGVAGFDLLLLGARRRPWVRPLLLLSPYLHAAVLGGVWLYALYWVYPDPLAREVMLLSSFALPVLYAPLYVRLRARRALRRSLVLLGAFGALHLPHAMLGLNGPFPLDGIVFPFVVFSPQVLLLAVLTTLAAHAQRAQRATERAAQLERQAFFDALTGVANRWRAEALLEEMLAEVRRGAAPFGVLVIDIDRFKGINDCYGHGVGDAVLREVAAQLGRHVRSGDTLARWGGEEFVVLAPAADRVEVARLGERLRRGVAAGPLAGHAVTVSVGGACATRKDVAATLVARADRALYRAKHAGRNRTVVEG
jgi:diguanylate cyclase (GGDEF)-like protein